MTITESQPNTHLTASRLLPIHTF